MYAAVPVKGSPFNAKAYDTEQVVISSIGQGILGKPVDFYCKYILFLLQSFILFFYFILDF